MAGSGSGSLLKICAQLRGDPGGDSERVMVNQELLSVIDQLHREKGISQETLIVALESALLAAARKRYGGGENF